MKNLVILFAVSVLANPAARAQSASSAEVAELRRQVEALTQVVESLQQQLNQQRLTPMFGDGTSTNGGKSVTSIDPAAPAPPLQESRANLFNPAISVAIDSIGSYSRRADNVNFIVRDAEVLLEANVDHLARAYLVFNAETELAPTEKTDPFEEISLGIEEAAIETTGLPWGLQLKAGQFFADVTRLGKVHSHDLPFTDRPRSVDLLVGGETKARGLELNWVPKTPFYLRLTAGFVDNVGAEPTITRRLAFLEEGDEEFGELFAEGERRAFDNLTYYMRLVTVFDLGPQVQFALAGNYLRGRDAGTRTLASADAKLTWTPSPEKYDLFELGAEALQGRNSGRLADDFLVPDEETGTLVPASSTARARGGYVYAQYRFGKKWQPGVRFDFTRAESFEELDLDADGERDSIGRVRDDVSTYSAYLNYHFSEFNRLRLQVNYVKGDREIADGADNDFQAFLQWSVILGPHKHSYQP